MNGSLVDVKAEILRFLKASYAKNGKVLSIRAIEKKFKRQGVTRATFYGLFPEGLEEACREAGVPAPDRLKQTEQALKKKKEKFSLVTLTRDEQPSSFRLSLTEEQTKRLLAISHLEGGMDLSLIMDDLLDFDAKMRKSHKLNFPKVKRVSDFLEVAIERGWSTKSVPNVVSFVTDLWNSGCKSLSGAQIRTVAEFLDGMKKFGWKPEEIPEFLTKLSHRGLNNLLPEIVR